MGLRAGRGVGPPRSFQALHLLGRTVNSAQGVFNGTPLCLRLLADRESAAQKDTGFGFGG